MVTVSNLLQIRNLINKVPIGADFVLYGYHQNTSDVHVARDQRGRNREKVKNLY